MNGRITSVSEALELLVPPFEQREGDGWESIVARAVRPAAVSRPRRASRRRIALIAIAAALVATLVATPAFGIRGLLADLIGRHDVPFTGKTAPVEVKRNFFDLSLGAPSSMDPNAIASQARRVASFVVHGRAHVLFVAPTAAGGYCWELSGAFGGCRPHRDLRSSFGANYQVTRRQGSPIRHGARR